VYEDEDEELEESDDDRTLPTEEFWEGLQKVKDPTIPIQDRMAIASLLLVKREALCSPQFNILTCIRRTHIFVDTLIGNGYAA
jgi:hypothetical protein